MRFEIRAGNYNHGDEYDKEGKIIEGYKIVKGDIKILVKDKQWLYLLMKSDDDLRVPAIYFLSFTPKTPAKTLW